MSDDSLESLTQDEDIICCSQADYKRSVISNSFSSKKRPVSDLLNLNLQPTPLPSTAPPCGKKQKKLRKSCDLPASTSKISPPSTPATDNGSYSNSPTTDSDADTESSPTAIFGAKTPPSSTMSDPSEWTCEDVKKWIWGIFPDKILVEKFHQQEVDGTTLLSETILSNESMEILGLNTIGKKAIFKFKLLELKDSAPEANKSMVKDSHLIEEDRLLTHKEKNRLTCEQKRIYNTKKKAVVKEVYKEWPISGKIPHFRKTNEEENLKLDTFVERISQTPKYIYPECAFGRHAIRQLVMNQMRERRRALQEQSGSPTGDITTESEVESSADSLDNPHPANKKANASDYFHPKLSQESCDAILQVVFQKFSVKDIQMAKHLIPLKKLFKLTYLRAQEKKMYIRAIANSLLSNGYITLTEDADLQNIKRGDITVAKSLPDL